MPNKSAFTLAELIVVVTILAVLAAVGFVALSGYSQDAADSRAKANVRSVYSAVSAESALTGNSPRYYVVHDSGASLSGGIAFVDGNPSVLTGGQYGTPGTNYSAGNPDWPKLKLNPEKFRISGLASRFASVFLPVEAAYDPSTVLLAAAELTAPAASGKPRTVGYVQAAGIPASGIPFVVGNYPVGASGSVAGLLKDPSSASSTGALIDGAKTSVQSSGGGGAQTSGCAAATVSGYSVPVLADGQSAHVSKSTTNGSVTATASCSFGVLSVGGDSAVCDSGYVASGLSCIADVCGSTVPAHATSTATSQSVSGTWHYSAIPGQCTFACSANYSWDSASSSCKADCQLPISASHSGLPYALSST